jgi:NAD(P)-dependent dehydrogenase (short-subunit alcohol dehydrogenase family)
MDDDDDDDGNGGDRDVVYDDPGRIINIGSVTGILPQDAPTHAYDVSKAAVHHLTRKFANDLASRGITVNAIAPGYVLTRMSGGLLSKWSKAEEDGKEDGKEDGVGSTMDGGRRLPIPLGRMGNADDMGGACIYLSSRAGSWITGVILTVDGGLVGAANIPLSNL